MAAIAGGELLAVAETNTHHVLGDLWLKGGLARFLEHVVLTEPAPQSIRPA